MNNVPTMISAPAPCMNCGETIYGNRPFTLAGDPHDCVRVVGVVFLIFGERSRFVLMEQCPRKREFFGKGNLFLPGGKVEPGENVNHAVHREAKEELGINVRVWRALPLVESVGGQGKFMRPALIESYDGDIPPATLDHGHPLMFVPFRSALQSEVAEVRMMLAAARPLALNP